MLKNKMKKCIYNIIFWISRFITLFIFGICFTAVLNAKYIFLETFFSKIMFFSLYISWYIADFIYKISKIVRPFSILKFSLFTDPDAITPKYSIYKLFCVNSQNIDILIYTFILILLIYFIIKHILKLKDKQLILSIILLIFLIYLSTYFITGNCNFLLTSFVSPIIFIIIYILNLYIPLKIQNIIIAFPVIGELFSINNVILFITKKQQKEVFVLIVSIIVSNVVFIFMPYYNNGPFNTLVSDSAAYNITVDNKQNRLIMSTNPILLVDGSTSKSLELKTDIQLYQDVLANWEKEEIYIYSVNDGIFYVMDINTGEEKAKIKIVDFDAIKNDKIFARCIYNSKTDVILIVFESKFGTFLIDLKKMQIIQHYKTWEPNDCILYNKFRNSYILTYFQCQYELQEINLENNSIKDIVVGSEQGYAAISEQNKEIYIAFHQQGQIYVYDAETMDFKRKIKSNYTVKDITYDEDLNVLIAPSYFLGYIDIFLMDGSDKLILRQFAGYDLREARFDTKKENLYVCSRNWVSKIPINIKELIKKNHNVKENNL